MSDCFAAYRARAADWLAAHAPDFSGQARRGLSFEQDVELARRWQALKAASGYVGITLPREHGGQDGHEAEKLAFDEEELRYDLPTEYFSISLSMPIPMIARHATPEQKQRLIPPALRGDTIWCQLFSEPAAGSDLAALRLAASREGDGWRLNGQKLWTSWAQLSDHGVIVARHDPSLPKHAGLTYFMVDMSAPGVTVRTLRRMSGHCDVNEVFFDNVFVRDTERLGPVGGGFRLAIETLTIERYAVTDEAGYGPPLEALIPLCANRSGERLQIDDSHVRAIIADALVERAGLKAINARAVAAIAAGAEPGPEGAIRKLLSATTRMRIAELALDLSGSTGVAFDPLDSLRESFTQSWLDAPSLRIAGGTDEMLRNTIAERILNLPQDHRPDKGVPFNASNGR